MTITSRGSISLLRPLRFPSGCSRPVMPLRAKVSNPQFANTAKTMSTQLTEEENDVLFTQNRGTKSILLNRPKKLNSLNLSMIQKILPRLKTWEKSELTKTILMKGAGDKAFCAGGDVTVLATLPDDNMATLAARQNYFRHEYTLDYYLSTYDKPMVAIMDGITMGGGVGLSINCPFRIATEKTLFAMPETLIGFFPDVGATYFLPRLDGELGIYLGLTGHQLNAYDTVWTGIATHYVPSERLPALEDRLAEVETDDFAKVNAILEEFESGPPKGYHFTLSPEIQDAIDRIFANKDLSTIMRLLQEESQSNSPASQWAQTTIETLNERSPVSIHVSNAAMRATLNQTRYQTFQREYELATAFVRQPDFKNGVIARLINRTKPTWSLPPSALSREPDWVQREIFDAGRYFETLAQPFYMLAEGKSDFSTQESGLFRWSLPVEGTVLAILMKGKTDGSIGEDAKWTRQELVEYIVGERLGKPGAERKLNFILDRNTVEDANGKLLWKFKSASLED